MTKEKENKDLLLRYLTMAIPYNVVVSCIIIDYNTEEKEKGNHPTYKGDGTLFLIDKLSNRACIRPILEGKSYREKVYFEQMCNKGYIAIENVKPYLRPLSSMTERELDELNCLCYHNISVQDDVLCGHICYTEIIDVQNFLLRYHFDFMDLIPKGLAIEVGEVDNPYKG